MGSLDKDKSNTSSLYILYCVIFSITTRLTIVSIPSHNFVLLSGTLALFLFSLTILYQFIYKSLCIDIIIDFHLYISRNTIFISSNLSFIPFVPYNQQSRLKSGSAVSFFNTSRIYCEVFNNLSKVNCLLIHTTPSLNNSIPSNRNGRIFSM